MTYEIKLAYAKQLEKEWNHYDGSCDPEDYLVDLITDINGALDDKFGESDDNFDITLDVVYK